MNNFLQNLYNKYININIFPYDKMVHFIAGMLLAIPGIMIFHISLDACLPAIVVGVGKEIYDYFHQPFHDPELADAACTVFGGLLVVMFMGYIL